MTLYRHKCRFCEAPLEIVFADLGETPLANSYVTAADIAAGRDPVYPLRVRVCGTCLLVQAEEVVHQADIFDESYAYFSSYATTWVEHAKRYQVDMTARFGLGAASHVVEVASNDGYLLQHFVSAGIPALGIEPTASTAREAIRRGVPTRIAYFSTKLGETLAQDGLGADLMAANNVLAHVPDILDFVGGFAALLKPEGVATFEFPHLLNLIQQLQFDTIYHEHYSYLSLLVVRRVLERAGLRVFDVQELPTHGGSLRVFACPARSGRKTSDAVAHVIARETAAQLDRIEGYLGFQPRIDHACRAFRTFLADSKSAGRTVAAYGAAAKGNTFLNVCRVTVADLPMVADLSHAKQGKYLPGSHIPIVSPEQLAAARPDYVVVLPWNLIDEITAQLAPMSANGSRFVVAIPETRIV
jgi:SAM-dependent methyltransferase